MVINQIKINKPWGYEITWTKTGSIVGKIFGIDRDQSLIRSKSVRVEESLLVVSGTLVITTDSDQVELKRGQSFNAAALKEYIFSAPFGDVEIIIVKTTN